MRLNTPMLSPEAVQSLSGHDEPGNIRELKNVVERALIESRGGDIGPEHLPLGVSRAPQAASPTTVQDAIEALPPPTDDGCCITVGRLYHRAPGPPLENYSTTNE